MTGNITRLLASSLSFVFLASCASAIRPNTPVAVDTLSYNQAIANAKQQQLLLNIVRLRYNDPVNFLDIQTFTTEDSTLTAGELTSGVGLGGEAFADFGTALGRYERAHTPTMIYGHLRGGAYAQQLLKPVPPSSIFLLSQSGWSVERLMLCCVARIGDLDNARAAAGPTPDIMPDNADFKALAAKIRALQVNGDLRVQVVEEEDTGARVLMKWQKDASGGEALAQFMRKHSAGDIQELPNNRYAAEITTRGNELGEFSVRGRSLLGIMSALSQTVNVPAEHSALVVETGGGAASRLAGPCMPAGPWGDVIEGYFAVQSSKTRPDGASVAVPYRGHWFYIDDTCRSAKSTLDLLGHLFALQAGLSGAGESDAIVLLGG